MTDTLDVQGHFAPADFQSTDIVDATPFTPEVEAEAEAEAVALPNGFLKLGLAPELLAAIADLGFSQPTTVQEQTIPLALPGEDAGARFIDLMVSSQTGSGKTAAFLLPVLHTLLGDKARAVEEERLEYERLCAQAAERGEPVPKRTRRKDPTNPRNFSPAEPGALILCPTRELAQQVAHDAIELVKHCRGLRVANVVGGMPYQIQIQRLQNADLVVATPGRLLDLQRSMQIKLDKVRFLVVDEADRMLDLGFADDLAELNQLTIARGQTMMFSATFAPRIQQLAARVMREPRRVQVDSPQERHVNIKQVLFHADNLAHKRKLLDHWLRDATINQAIVFASTQVECDGLAHELQQDGFSAVALHGALSQGLRNRRLMALRSGQVQILVATDVAARGLDVPSITHVFNFGLPMKAEDYTHRIGRTGRAGRDGIAVTFAEMRDRRRLFDIEAYTRQPFKSEVIPGLEPQVRQQPRGGFGGGRPNDRGGNDRGGFRAARGGRDGGFHRDNQLHREGGQREGFQARDSGFPPRDSGFQQRDNGFPPRDAGFQRDAGGFGDRAPAPGYGRKRGFGETGGREVGAWSARREGDGFAAAPGARPARPGNGGKVFVPRDVKKRPYKPAR